MNNVFCLLDSLFNNRHLFNLDTFWCLAENALHKLLVIAASCFMPIYNCRNSFLPHRKWMWLVEW